MNRLLIRGEMFGQFQYLYVFHGEQMIEKLGVTMDDMQETVFSLIQKHNIKHIDLSGAHRFMLGIEDQLKRASIETYSLDDISFRYI